MLPEGAGCLGEDLLGALQGSGVPEDPATVRLPVAGAENLIGGAVDDPVGPINLPGEGPHLEGDRLFRSVPSGGLLLPPGAGWHAFQCGKSV